VDQLAWKLAHRPWPSGLYILSGLVSFRKGIFDQEGFSRPALGRLLAVFVASLAALF